MIIDVHNHFWNYDPVEFGWIGKGMESIRKNFLPEDLFETISKSGVEGVISVQARQSLQETEWLLKLAAEHDFIKGIIGWVPLSADNAAGYLEKYSDNSLLKGVRHVVQDEPDQGFISGESFNRGISLLKHFGLVYDILIFEHQLPNAILFVQKHPDQQFVLDHIAKPKIKTNEIKNWSRNLKKLASYENVSCKISGMVTEADFRKWTEEQLKPYFEVVLDAFGAHRLMFGSDWPVCLVATEYNGWLNLVKKNISGLSSSEQDQIFYLNAQRTYNL